MRLDPRARVLPLLALLSCGAPEARRAALSSASADTGDPAVVAIVGPDHQTWCSGTLVDPHVVLTAAHCLLAGFTVEQYQVFFGPSLSAGGTTLELTQAQRDPAFDPTSLAHDLGLVTLRHAAPVAALPLDARAVDASFVGQPFTAVGFGFTAPSAGDAGEKRSGPAQVAAVSDVELTTTPGSSQACMFDSGSPALFSTGGGLVVTGVASHGDTGCADHTAYARVDVGTAGFLAPALAALAPGSASVGDRCYHDDQCRGGPCLVAADEPRLGFCSQPCTKSSDCPAPMTCAADGCRYPTPSPGALGATCAAGTDCLSGLCVDGACTQTCVPVGQAAACPSGFQCENEAGGIAFHCRRVTGGCAIASPDGDPDGAALVLLLLALVAVIRSRRTWSTSGADS